MNLKLKAKIVEQFGSQTVFSKVIGIREPLISRFIRRHREPTQEQKQTIADALSVTVDFLFAPVPERRRYSGQGQCYERRSFHKKDQ